MAKITKKIKTLSSLPAEQLKKFAIVLCSEKSIRCKHLHFFQEIAKTNHTVFIAMPQWELIKGSRGLGKAQILGSLEGVEGIISCSRNDLNRLTGGELGSVKQLGEISFQNHESLLEGASLDKEIKIKQISNPVDRKFMSQAQKLMPKSDCWWRPTACLFVKKSIVLIRATSHNPWKTNCRHLLIKPEEIKLASGEQIEFCNAIHAEKTGIAKAAKQGVSLEGSYLYVTCCPCEECAKIIVEAGVKKVVFDSEYYNRTGLHLLEKEGIVLAKIMKK